MWKTCNRSRPLFILGSFPNHIFLVFNFARFASPQDAVRAYNRHAAPIPHERTPATTPRQSSVLRRHLNVGSCGADNANDDDDANVDSDIADDDNDNADDGDDHDEDDNND